MKFVNREGLIVRYQDGLCEIFSEIAPLPGFSIESTDDVQSVAFGLIDVVDTHLKTPDLAAWNVWVKDEPLPPSVRFGLDALMRQRVAAIKGTPLHVSLNPKSEGSIGTNAVLGIIPPDDLEVQTDKLVRDGYRTIKYKVGNPEPYIEAWMRIRVRHPHLHMRFDANGSWQTDSANQWIKLLEPIRPEYVEQPIEAGCEPAMAELQRTVNFPIAYDESARDLASVLSILKMSPRSVIILKPMLLGSISELKEIIGAISSEGSIFTITTLIESGIARNMVASVAAAYSDSSVDHGLGTGSLFAEDVLEDYNMGLGTFVIDPNPARRINRTLLESFRIM